MGFFTFLTQQEDQPNPEGWKVRRKGKDYWENNPDTPAGPEDEIDRQDQTPIATPDEMKTYSQRRGETSSKVFQTADKIIDKFGGLNQDLATQAKREVRSNPENAAKTIEKYLTNVVSRQNDAAGVPMGDPDISGHYDQDFSALENHVRGLRTMKRGAEEKTLTGQLAGADLKKNLSELQNLKGQLDILTKDIAGQNLPEAVSSRGEQENKQALGYKQQKAAALAEHIKQLEKVTSQNQPQPTEDVAETAEPSLPAPGTDRPVSHFMKGLIGADSGALTGRIYGALNAVGIPAHEWGDTNVDTAAGMMRVLSELDPKGTFAQMISQAMLQAKNEDLAGSQTKGAQAPTEQAGQQQQDPGIWRAQRAIEGKEAQMRQLYAQLQQTPFMRTWPGIVLYVLVGLLTQNPAFAAKLIGGVWNKAAVNAEIKGIQFDLRRLDHELQWRERNDQEMKREAARRLTHREDIADQRKWEYSKMMIQHKLIIDRNAKRGNPETFLMKKLSSDFQRNLGMAAKFQGTMQNEFADPKDRAEAKRNWELYMRRAAELDGDIRKLGGSVIAPEPEAEE